VKLTNKCNKSKNGGNIFETSTGNKPRKDIDVGASTDCASYMCKKVSRSLQKNPAAWMLHGVTLHNIRCRLYSGLCN